MENYIYIGSGYCCVHNFVDYCDYKGRGYDAFDIVICSPSFQSSFGWPGMWYGPHVKCVELFSYLAYGID